jgi:hypothetical protein
MMPSKRLWRPSTRWRIALLMGAPQELRGWKQLNEAWSWPLRHPFISDFA